MDFEQGVQDTGLAAVLAANAPAIDAMETADLAGIRETVIGVQRGLAAAGYAFAPGPDWPTTLAGSLCLAKASTSLFLAVQATRQCAAVLGPDKGLDLARGEAIGAVALSEPATDDGSPATLADGVLKGRKSFVTNGPIADVVAVIARGGGGQVACHVLRGQAGVIAGARISMAGLPGLAVCDLAFDGATVAPDVIGETLDRSYALDADLTLAFACTGLMQRVLAAAKAHAAGHSRGGRPVLKQQEVGFKLAEMLTATHAAELLARRAAWMVSTGKDEAPTLVRCARIFCAEGAERVASAAMQVAAGEGYVAGSVFERAWRDAKGLAVAGTTLEVARMAVADDLLARY